MAGGSQLVSEDEKTIISLLAVLVGLTKNKSPVQTARLHTLNTYIKTKYRQPQHFHILIRAWLMPEQQWAENDTTIPLSLFLHAIHYISLPCAQKHNFS